MEKHIEVKKNITINEIEFYCDDCGKFLGETEECDDGYYEEIGKFVVKFNFGGWYKLEKHLCDACKEKEIAQIEKTLNELGFVKDE